MGAQNLGRCCVCPVGHSCFDIRHRRPAGVRVTTSYIRLAAIQWRVVNALPLCLSVCLSVCVFVRVILCWCNDKSHTCTRLRSCAVVSTPLSYFHVNIYTVSQKRRSNLHRAVLVISCIILLICATNLWFLMVRLIAIRNFNRAINRDYYD